MQVIFLNHDIDNISSQEFSAFLFYFAIATTSREIKFLAIYCKSKKPVQILPYPVLQIQV